MLLPDPHHHHTPPPLPLNPSPRTSPSSQSHSPPSADRDLRLERAVALVTDAKYSVRKAAHALSLPKSTVHRYLQATRSAPPASSTTSAPAAAAAAASAAARVAKRPRSVRRKACMARPPKCELAFLLQGKDAGREEREDWGTRLSKGDDVGRYYQVQRSNLRRIWA